MAGDANVRSKFAGGALEFASHILGSASASIFVVGLIGPYIAALSAPRAMPSMTVLSVMAIAVGLSMTAGIGAVVLRGLGHCAAHDLLGPKRAARPRASVESDGAGQ